MDIASRRKGQSFSSRACAMLRTEPCPWVPQDTGSRPCGTAGGSSARCRPRCPAEGPGTLPGRGLLLRAAETVLRTARRGPGSETYGQRGRCTRRNPLRGDGTRERRDGAAGRSGNGAGRRGGRRPPGSAGAAGSAGEPARPPATSARQHCPLSAERRGAGGGERAMPPGSAAPLPPVRGAARSRPACPGLGTRGAGGAAGSTRSSGRCAAGSSAASRAAGALHGPGGFSPVTLPTGRDAALRPRCAPRLRVPAVGCS